jgi:hypothetical protein
VPPFPSVTTLTGDAVTECHGGRLGVVHIVATVARDFCVCLGLERVVLSTWRLLRVRRAHRGADRKGFSSPDRCSGTLGQSKSRKRLRNRSGAAAACRSAVAVRWRRPDARRAAKMGQKSASQAAPPPPRGDFCADVARLLPVEERDCGIDICGGGSATIWARPRHDVSVTTRRPRVSSCVRQAPCSAEAARRRASRATHPLCQHARRGSRPPRRAHPCCANKPTRQAHPPPPALCVARRPGTLQHAGRRLSQQRRRSARCVLPGKESKALVVGRPHPLAGNCTCPRPRHGRTVAEQRTRAAARSLAEEVPLFVDRGRKPSPFFSPPLAAHASHCLPPLTGCCDSHSGTPHRRWPPRPRHRHRHG